MSESKPRGSGAEGPSYVVLQTCHTLAAARVVTSLLEGAGIPAHIDGELLADEFAVSQRALRGVRILVPPSALTQAREILAAEQPTEEELTAAALAADNPEHLDPPRPGPDRPGDVLRKLLLAGAGGLALLFFALWQLEVAGARAAADSDPLATWEHQGATLIATWRSNGKVWRRLYDSNHNGVYERQDQHDPQGRLIGVLEDADENGIWEHTREFRADGLITEGYDDDQDGLLDRMVNLDAKGQPARTQHYVAGRGFEDVR